VQSNYVSGISVRTSGTVSGCFVSGNRFDGIFLNSGTVTGNTCISNNLSGNSARAGIKIGSGARAEDNHVTASGHAGIFVIPGGTNNIVVKNNVSDNGANNYLVPAKNVLGPILNDSNGAITNSSPWGNFSF